MSDLNANLPGRLGNTATTLATDPRTDPRIVAAMAMAPAPEVDPVGADASYADCLAYCEALENDSAAAHPLMMAAMPQMNSLTTSTEVIQGVDDNDIVLYISQPKERRGPLPCIVHIHGGGMVVMTAQDPLFLRWRDSLADSGMVVIGVEFRNGAGQLGNHPFPAGLNDCASAVQWAFANKARLDLSSIVLSGESGGGNLSLATALKAQQEGWVNQIDGVYAMCPYISGAYANPPPYLLSLRENDDYMLNCTMMGALVKAYDPQGIHGENPLAWPLQADASLLEGLPPHVISVNELDPLRDEGQAYYRKLTAAGVSAIGRTVHGTPHAGDISFPDFIPEVYQDSVRSVHGFANSL